VLGTLAHESDPEGAARSPLRAGGNRRVPHTGRRIGALRALARGRRRAWLAFTVLLVAVGAAASILGAQAVGRSDASKARLSFHLSSAEIASTLQLALQHEEDLVTAASAFVTSEDRVTPVGFDHWAQAVKALTRYPELQNIGLVRLVPAGKLAEFERGIAREPVEPFGPGSASHGSFQVFPAGERPAYCFAVAGLSRSSASYLPSGLDYCAIAPELMTSRQSGIASYAPFSVGNSTELGVQTPVYGAGAVPKTEAARRARFVGWLGELLVPNVVIARALQGHSNTSVRFVYRASPAATPVVFHKGEVPATPESATFNLHNGWTVQTFTAPIAATVFGDRNALTLLVGGLLMSALVGLLTMILGTGRMRALALVREKTRELSHLAMHDALTGLPNRALVLDRAEQMLARVARSPELVAGALYVDVDGFKRVNDKLGHPAGDQLLRVVGERLLSAVRAEDTVGRLGGDEFVVLVEAARGSDALDKLAGRLIEALRAPVELDDGRQLFSVTASVGLAMGTYRSSDELLRDADLALYAAKAEGKDRYVLYDSRLDRSAETRAELELELGSALQGRQFFLAYQPIFDLAAQRVIGVEALVRWSHPVRGIVPPNEFIPLAEESGLIVSIGRWVLGDACAQAASWQRRGLRLGVSVNVSAFQLGRESFASDVREALSESGLDASLLTLEITETAFMRDLASASARLQEIREMGVQVAIDDFGTGYASLASLQRMPVDVLKVDRSFVAALEETGGHGRELLEAIVGVSHALSLRVVAEGIEVESQMTTLRELGCEMAQGFLMGRPSSAEAIEELLDAARPDGTAVEPARATRVAN
jgi:diguanylate cyclase (GGDEF)-like protein